MMMHLFYNGTLLVFMDAIVFYVILYKENVVEVAL